MQGVQEAVFRQGWNRLRGQPHQTFEVAHRVLADRKLQERH